MGLKLFTLIFLFAFSAPAAVDMTSAGYVNTWIDYESPGEGYELKIARIYKSRTVYNGLFGFGWCSPFETLLQVLPEGSIRISECGSGQAMIYTREKTDLKAVEAVVTSILQKIKEDPDRKQVSAVYLKKIRRELFEDDARRASLAAQYGIGKEVQEKTPYLLNGTQLENIVWDRDQKHYTRRLTDGRSQRFDEKGRLTRSHDRHGNFIRLVYEQDRLVRVENSNSNSLRFKYGSHGKVAQAQSGEAVIKYRYSPEGDLLTAEIQSAKGQEPQLYTYEYDAHHNMIRAGWPDRSSVAVQYDRQQDRVKKITARDGCAEEFAYKTGGSESKPYHRATSVRSCGGERAGREVYEFWYEPSPAGPMALSRVRTDLGGKVEDLTYDPVTGMKKTVKNSGEKITFEYDESGRLKSRRSSRLQVRYTYLPGSQNVATCEQKSFDTSGKPLATLKTSAKYNDRGQLIEAETSANQKLQISYDEKSRIRRLVNQEQTRFEVEYDERHGKPARITASGLGSVKISYAGSGAIRAIESPDGLAMALRVSSAYEKNLNILNPVQRVLYR